MTNDIQRGLFSLKSLAAGIAIGLAVFLVALFALGLTSEVKRGEDGQRAIQMLDAMRRPFLNIKKAETELLEGGDAQAASAKLESEIKAGNVLLERYKELAAYNPEVSARVTELAEEYGSLVYVERRLFDHISQNRRVKDKGTVTDRRLPGYINGASIAFLKTMELLGSGETPIHGDIDAGRRGINKLLGLSSLLFLYLIGLIFYHQNRRSLALKRSSNELTEQMELRKKTEEEITSLGRILEDSLNEIYIFNAQSLKFLLVNEGARKNLGFSMEELQNLTPLYIESEYTYESFKALIEPLKNGEVNGIKFTAAHKRKDGSLYPAEVYLQLSTFGAVPAFVAIVLDITMRKRAEEALKKSEERYRQLIDNVDMGINLVDKDYNIVMTNRYQGEVLNKPSSQLIGASCFEEFEAREEVCTHCPGTLAMESGRPEGVDTEKVLSDGSRSCAHIRAFPIFNSGGQATGFVEVIEDTTERRRVEAEIHKTQKLESIGLLAGGIAHDFNNVITGILGNISLAKIYSTPNGKAFERLSEAENAVEHATRLSQQLLTFSEGGEPIKEPAYLRNLIKDSISFSLSGSNVKHEYSIREDLRPVEMDTGQIGQVISNIAMNARYAMPDGGLLKVSAQNITLGNHEKEALHGLLNAGPYIKISIEDNGTGIEKIYLDRIFDPYFSTKKEGGGLGLATSYSIIKKHDGHITVESQPGAGATFHLYLPASEELPADKDSEELITGPKGEKQKDIRVLVMDDEEIVRNIASEMLTSLGYEVATAEEGNDAVEMYKKAKESSNPFDVVIMDLTIAGGLGGREAIVKLLKIDPDAKAIVSSGYSYDPIMSEYKKYGFHGVIAKPYKLTELGAKVYTVASVEE